MQPKPDGRLYSRVLRRIVAITELLAPRHSKTIGEIADGVYSAKLPVFYLERFVRSISSERIRDYVRYLRDLKILEETDGKLRLVMAKKQRDEEWAQAMSDRAREHLGSILEKSPADVASLLESRRRALLRTQRIPTLDAISADLKIEGGRAQELFRWSMYVYADGPTSDIQIRRYPVITSSAE
jgi:hypothetical protein